MSNLAFKVVWEQPVPVNAITQPAKLSFDLPLGVLVQDNKVAFMDAVNYDTYADLQAANLANGKTAVVINDPDLSKNGYYQKTASGFVKPNYPNYWMSGFLGDINAIIGNAELTAQQKLAALQTLINNAQASTNTEISNLQQSIQIAAAAGAGSNGWTAQLIADESGKTQQEINNQIKTPLFVNADDTGSIDATSQLASLLDPNGKHVIQLTKGTYLVDSLVIPNNTIVYGNGAIIKRRQHTNSPTVVVGKNSVIFGLKVDGNKAVLGAYGNIARGIDLRRNAAAIFCESYNNDRHGFYTMNEDLMVFDPPSENQKMLFCKAYDNGFNPGGAGTGDGFSALNSNNVLYLGCESWNNARTGFVATTYDRNTTHTDKSYSSGVRAVNCKAWGNGYSDLNFEGVTNGGVIGGEYASLTYSFSDKGVFSDVVVRRGFYAQDSDYISVNNIRVESELSANNNFYVTGKTPLVNNVRVTVGESANITSPSVTALVEASDGLGSVSNIHLNRAYFGIRLKVANAVNLTVEEASTARILIKRGSEPSLLVNDFIKLSNGSLEFSSNSIPTSGYSKIGDIIRSTSRYSRGEIGWVCTTSGTGSAAKWTAFGNVGGVPSQATFLSGTVEPAYDANDFTAGTSYYASSTDTKTYTNFPFSLVDSRLIINTSYNSAINQGWLQQEAISVLSNKRARRIKSAIGAWTAWELF